MTHLVGERQYVNADSLSPVDASDEACLHDVRQVLERHGKIGRFGVHLLHAHFDIGDDEVLLETCDQDQRILVSRIAKADSNDARSSIETSWAFDAAADRRCQRKCVRTGDSHHQSHVFTHQ
ncbi:MAG: hypothetical protein ACLFQ5_12570 [Oceanicaulis sp.]